MPMNSIDYSPSFLWNQWHCTTKHADILDRRGRGDRCDILPPRGYGDECSGGDEKEHEFCCCCVFDDDGFRHHTSGSGHSAAACGYQHDRLLSSGSGVHPSPPWLRRAIPACHRENRSPSCACPLVACFGCACRKKVMAFCMLADFHPSIQHVFVSGILYFIQAQHPTDLFAEATAGASVFALHSCAVEDHCSSVAKTKCDLLLWLTCLPFGLSFLAESFSRCGVSFALKTWTPRLDCSSHHEQNGYRTIGTNAQPKLHHLWL